MERRRDNEAVDQAGGWVSEAAGGAGLGLSPILDSISISELQTRPN